MTTTVKVLPTADENIGLVHPVDGALAAEGSVWRYDAFTERMIQAEVIRRFEVPADEAAPVEAKAAKAKTASAA